MLHWEYPPQGEVKAKAVNREDPIAIYEVIEVPPERRGRPSEYTARVTTETGPFELHPSPHRSRFRNMQTAQQACLIHFNRCRREIAESRQEPLPLPLPE